MIKHVTWLFQPKKSIASLFGKLILNQNSVSQFSSNILGNNDGYKSVGLSACGGCYDCTFRFKRDYHKILRQLKGRACNHQNGRDIYHRWCCIQHPGLSIDSFIPPQGLIKEYPEDNLDWRSPVHWWKWSSHHIYCYRLTHYYWIPQEWFLFFLDDYSFIWYFSSLCCFICC